MQSNIDTVLDHCEGKYRRLMASGFRIRNLNPAQAASDLRTLYEISLEAFKDNLFYAPISFELFRALYEPKLRSIAANYLKFAETADGKAVGFLFSMPDYTSVLSSHNLLKRFDKISAWLQIKYQKIPGIVHKSTAVSPQARGNGIESALIYAMTKEAKAKGASYVIGAFASIENPSTRCLGPTQKRNLYRLYELST